MRPSPANAAQSRRQQAEGPGLSPFVPAPEAEAVRRCRALGGEMVLLSVPLWLRSRLTDRFWRVQEVLKYARVSAVRSGCSSPWTSGSLQAAEKKTNSVLRGLGGITLEAWGCFSMCEELGGSVPEG